MMAYTMSYIYSFDYYAESWIEVGSQPSSSSLSSIETDQHLATGLRAPTNARRRRRMNSNLPTRTTSAIRSDSTGGSSQEEYDESESESDRILGSSNEDLHPAFRNEEASPAEESHPNTVTDEDDDENSTALGIISNPPVFTPQPNAFSHPTTHHPTTQTPRHGHTSSVPDSCFPPSPASTSRTTAQRYSYPSHHQRNRSHTPYNMIAPSYQADHDAALRASLSTLLSCAAAARGLPKRESTIAQSNPQRAGPSQVSNRVEPTTIRLVPESALNHEPRQSQQAHQYQQTTLRQRTGPIIRRLSDSSSKSSPSIPNKHKRKSSSSRDRSETSTKKRHQSTSNIEDVFISPTLMTWMVSAGVVVLFSAISFSAGFAYGRDVGMLEAQSGLGSNVTAGAGCGREMGRGLRRFRWSGGGASVARVS